MQSNDKAITKQELLANWRQKSLEAQKPLLLQSRQSGPIEDHSACFLTERLPDYSKVSA